MRALLIVCILLAGCGEARTTLKEKSLDAVNTALNQNDGIAEALKPDKPIHAAGIKDNGQAIRNVLRVNADNDAAVQLFDMFKVDSEQEIARITAEWENAREALERQINVNQAKFEAAKEEAEAKGFVAKLLVGLGVAWATIKTFRGPIKTAASILGIPFVGRIVDVISGVGNREDVIDNLKTLVHGSDKGIKEVERIEKVLYTQFPEMAQAVRERTGGRTFADLVKEVAKHIAVDNGKHEKVKRQLAQVRDEFPSNNLSDLEKELSNVR